MCVSHFDPDSDKFKKLNHLWCLGVTGNLSIFDIKELFFDVLTELQLN